MPTPPPGADQLYVDGHQLLFRAHYGFPARITSRDKTRDLTGVFGFFALLRAAIRDNLDQPPEIIVVFDGENGVAKRRAVDADYKTNRPEETPEPIKALGHVKRGLGICGIDWIEIEDEEADDVIGTLVTHSDAQRVVIMSGDKDYYQLLDERVRILNTARKAGQRLIGPEEIPARYGVTAPQWCDFRALTGDPSDGIHGIRGIGPKTATRLLQDGLALDDLPLSGRLTGRTGKAILQAWDQLLTWRDLIRMRTDIPVPHRPARQASPQLLPAPKVVERLDLW
jgi:DNA polymerase-1